MSSPTTVEIFTYKGELSFNAIEGILNEYKHCIQQFDVELVVRKRVYSILVECLENTFRHTSQNIANMKHTHVELYLYDADENFVISIGNHILNKNIAELTNRINLVNSLDQVGINRLYRASISKANISDKGGAGLGIIEIARNSRQKIDFEIESINHDTSFFRFEIKVSKNPNNSLLK